VYETFLVIIVHDGGVGWDGDAGFFSEHLSLSLGVERLSFSCRMSVLFDSAGNKA
jgi:hypothetical protein